MTAKSNVRKFTLKEAWLAGIAVFGFFALVSMSLHAQETVKPKEDKAQARSAIEVSGYTRPGNPDDRVNAQGDLIRQVGFQPQALKKFKIMGGTVYYAVFQNTAAVEGDTFGTGMANFDARFEAGRSFKDSVSPRYDKKAKYLYLYQVVNDRNLDPRINQVKGAKGGGGIKNPIFDPKAKFDPKAAPPVTEDIASFALKLIVDPRYITSWGHFRDSGFIAQVVDTDAAGVKQVVDAGKAMPFVDPDAGGKKVVGGGKKKIDKIMPLAFSSLAPIVTKISNPAYNRRARSHSLGDLEAGFGVDQASLNLQKSKAYGDLKLVAGQLGKDNIAWASYVGGLLKGTDSAKEPDYVQLMYLSSEERAAVGPVVPAASAEMLDEEITRAIFRVDWRNANLLKQGYRSVVFGFTTDLPPVAAPVRIDTPKAAAVSEGMRLASYFSEDTVARSAGDASGIALTAGGADSAALALAVGTALGSSVTPAPAIAPAAPGFAGITGGFSGLGGSNGGGGVGGGFGFPSLFGAFARPSGVIGGGGGVGGGTGSGNGTPSQTQQGSQATNPNVVVNTNFDASLLNQQQQQQKQFQFQFQNQQQNQNQNNRDHHAHRRHHGHGQVVPAPASLLLGLLGLPGLWFLRRRNKAAA